MKLEILKAFNCITLNGKLVNVTRGTLCLVLKISPTDYSQYDFSLISSKRKGQLNL